MNKKTIGILTEHNTINYGSFLQCYALQNILSKNFNIKIINYKKFGIVMKELFDLLKNKNFLNELKKIQSFKKFQKRFFNYHPRNLKNSITNTILKNIDCVIIGSDEMWNYKNPYRGYNEYYFGNFKKKNLKIISYATSFGAVNDLKLKKDRIVNLLNNFNLISVRDSHSLKLISDLKQDKYLILDPTYISDFPIDKDLNLKENYVFVYGFFEKEYKKVIKEYCKNQNLYTICCQPSNADWCNKYIPLNPFEWVTIIKKSKINFISSFHGTVFSIKHRKKFIYFPEYWSNNKVSPTLDLMGLKSCNFKNVGEINNNKLNNIYNENFVKNEKKLLEDTHLFLKKIDNLL